MLHPYRVPFCVPYWSGATYRALARGLLYSGVVDGAGLSRLRQRLAALFEVPDVVLCGGGGAAIELGLRALGVSEGEVIVPTFCCPDVIPPVLAAGALPVLTDVGDELNLTPAAVAAALTPRTRAVLVPHLFGNPAEIDAIRELCRPRGVAVIDDAAQALGATVGQRLVGGIGDVGIASFGNGKVCFGTGGGFLVARDRTVLERAARIGLPLSTWRAGVTRALTVLLFRRWRRWSHPLRVSLAGVRGRPAAGRRHYLRERMRNLDAMVASTLLDTLPDNLRARRARVTLYGKLLADHPRVALVPHRSGSACTKQIVRVDSMDAGGHAARRLIDTLRRAGYEVAPSYRPLHLHAEYRQFGRVPLEGAGRAWRTLVELPCEPSVSLADIERLCGIVRIALS